MTDSPEKKTKIDLDEQKAFAETLTSAPSIDEGLSTDTTEAGSEPEPLPSVQTRPAEKTRTAPPWAGKLLGRFKLLRLIGEGAMGLVIQAEDTSLKRIVALKVLRKQLAAGEKGKNAVEQFVREARAAAAIEHPNIVRVYEINQHAGWWYIAMEMVEGNSLAEIVKAAGALPESRACPVIADAATALHVAHEMGMIHRDVKPGNILVTRNGRGKVSDFGLVRINDPANPFDTYARKSIGTPLYMAPEIIRRAPISPAVDIYSLGATLYYTLTGRPPYSAEKMQDLFDQHLRSDPPDLKLYLPDCSPDLAALVKRMMAKQPEVRPTAKGVAAILHAQSISFAAESTAMPAVPEASTVLELQPAATRTRTRTAQTRTQTVTQMDDPEATIVAPRPVPWRLLVAAGSILLVVCCAVGAWFYMTRIAPQNPAAVPRLFPDAPSGYGTRAVASKPLAPVLIDPPAFSWIDKVDAGEAQFVAAKSGRYYYAINDIRAVLIRADEFVGYKTAEQAVEDGKLPAP